MNEPAPSDAAPSKGVMLVVLLLLLMVIGTPVLGFWWLRTAAERMADTLAVWHVRDMLVHYSAVTGGEWPRGWDDLEPSFEPADASYGTENLAALRARIEIDFSKDPSRLPTAESGGTAPPRLFWVREGRIPEEVDRANQRLAEHFAARAARRKGAGSVTDESS